MRTRSESSWVARRGLHAPSGARRRVGFCLTVSALTPRRFDKLVKIFGAVIDSDLFVWCNVAQCTEKDPAALNLRLAIRRTRVVDVTGEIFFSFAIDGESILEIKKEFRLERVGDRVGQFLPDVFDHSYALREGRAGKEFMGSSPLPYLHVLYQKD